MDIPCPRCDGKGLIPVDYLISDACRKGQHHQGCVYRFCECDCHDDNK